MPENRDRDLPVVRVEPRSYRPTEEELNEPIMFPPGTTPEDLARAVMTTVRVVEEAP